MIRQHLWNCARPLAMAGVLAPELLEPYRLAKGHRALLRSVCGVVTVFRAGWAHVAGKTHVSMALLDRAEARATELAPVLKSRRRTPVEFTRAILERRQAYTLPLREYSELRRAAHFLYGTREADRRVPSLFREGPRAQRCAGVRLAR